MPVVTKLGRVVTYIKDLQPLSYITLWSLDLVKSCDKLKTSLPQFLWPPNLVRWCICIANMFLKGGPVFMSLHQLTTTDDLLGIIHLVSTQNFPKN